MNKTIFNGFENLDVEIMKISDNPFKTFWDWYKMTWINLQNKEYDENDEEIKNACLDVLNNRALPTPQEMIQLELKITGLSRVGLAQITRGRVGFAYVVESQMPQKITHRVTVPKNLINSKFYNEIQELILKSQKLYDAMYDDGIPPQDCRYLTMHGQQTNLIMGVNFLALKGFFMMRAENGLTDELNLVCRLIRKRLREYINTSNDKNWEYLFDKLDCIGADRKVCLNYDKVFGNTGRYPSANDKIPSIDGKIKPDYDFTKSAWYEELLELDETLLFNDEKEMIRKWKDEKNY